MASPGLAGSTAQRDRRTWLIVGVHPDASATSKGGSAKGNARIRVRLAGTWRAEWNEDVIVLPVRGYRMGVESGGHVFDPGIGYRIDHAEHRPAGIIPSRHVEAVISLVEPNLIGATHLSNVCQDAASSDVEHNQVWRKCRTVVIRAPDEHVIEWALGQTRGLTLAHWKRVDDRHAPRVDHRDFAGRWIPIDLRDGQVEELRIRVPYRLLQPIGS